MSARYRKAGGLVVAAWKIAVSHRGMKLAEEWRHGFAVGELRELRATVFTLKIQLSKTGIQAYLV